MLIASIKSSFRMLLMKSKVKPFTASLGEYKHERGFSRSTYTRVVMEISEQSKRNDGNSETEMHENDGNHRRQSLR